MRFTLSLAVVVFATFAAPTFAADSKTPAPEAATPREFELPEIVIDMPAAKFEHAIVRDNEVPVVLLLV